MGDVVLWISTSISANYLDGLCCLLKLYSELVKSEVMLEGTEKTFSQSAVDDSAE